MPTHNSPNVTIRGTVAPPVHAHPWTIIIRTGDPPTETYVLTNQALLGNMGVTALHWASLLQTPVDFTLTADEQDPSHPAKDNRGYASLLKAQPLKDLNTAQLVERRAYGPDDLEPLKGLMDFRTLSPIQHSLSKHSRQMIDALEVIRWGDGSITSIEYQRASNGKFTHIAMLPPLEDLEDLATPASEPSNDPTEEYLRNEHRWRLLSEHMIATTALSTAVASNTPSARNPSSDGRLAAILRPALAASAAARQKLRSLQLDYAVRQHLTEKSP